MDATHWFLPSTQSSKYAHAPRWLIARLGSRLLPACLTYMPMLNLEPSDNRYAEGKPPCPRCIEAIERHQEFLASFVESYRHLTWEDEED